MLRRAAAALGHLAPPVPDNCELIELTEASVLENVRRRYEKREIYTFTGRRLLIALNPYEALASYSEVDMQRFPNKQARAGAGYEKSKYAPRFEHSQSAPNVSRSIAEGKADMEVTGV